MSPLAHRTRTLVEMLNTCVHYCVPVNRRRKQNHMCAKEKLNVRCWQLTRHNRPVDMGKWKRKLQNYPEPCRTRPIGLYRDVWIAAIASSRTRLATLTGAMYKTSQCELRSLRVNSGMLEVIRIVTYYTLPPLESPDSFWIAMAISR